MESIANKPFGLLVIGSGPAGVHAAASYVEAGGPGRVCLVSDDADAPYERPPLSKTVLAGEEPAEGSPILDDDSVWSRIDRRLGTYVEALDTDRRQVRTSQGDELSYDRLIVATGSRPSALPGADPDSRVFTLRSLEHARSLVDAVEGARSVVVVGSGFIGCEAAASLASRGLRPILVTPEPVPQAARLGDWVGSRITEWLESAGVELRPGVKVDKVEQPASVHLEDGSVIEADLVLAAVGVTQSQGFLAESGLLVEDDHLAVDAQLRTSDPHVWAAGDVARARHAVLGRSLSVEHWGDAITMGQLAGSNAAAQGPDGSGSSAEWTDPPGFWSEIGGHTLKYSAWGDGFEQFRVVEHPDEAFTVWYADAGGEVVGVLTHERDEDYERGTELLSRRASLTEALGDSAPEKSS
ncbi:NAD(P)/FAD-dependent oxidoreductase [Aeromicrobium sp. CF3.5]|uniref:NAD(P)/FAD-dependent oxidoreductase n=1 Tax=Aeromicrobium sp. CF3.5 TaxID=3373078 RepID=UPI003EE4F6F9